MSTLDPCTSNLGSVHEGSSVTLAGKSHSCDRPTSSWPRPRAQTISVALEISETIRIFGFHCERYCFLVCVPSSEHGLGVRTDDSLPPLLVISIGEVVAKVHAARFFALAGRRDHQPGHGQQVLQFPAFARLKL